MKAFTHIIAAAVLASICTPGMAQTGGAAPPPPTGTAAPAPPGADADAPAAEPYNPTLEPNPAVRAALEIPRREPADYFQAITWLIELDRAGLARPILDELAQLPLTDAERVALVEEFGSHGMLLLAQAKELAPAGAQFADACMNAAAAAATKPDRITSLVAQLTDPSAEVRLLARNDLAAAGQVGVTATLEALGLEKDPARSAMIADAVPNMHPLVVRPLIAMLETSDPALRGQVAELLQTLSVQQAAPLLQRTPATAERALRTAIDNHRRGMLPFTADASNQIELWHWDDVAGKLSTNHYPADEARVIWMARLARRLSTYFPENQVYRRQALLYGLEAAALANDPNSPALTEVRSADGNLLNELLADALASNYAYAAVAAIGQIEQRGNADVVYSIGAQPSPLSAALRHPNRRVRFAALRAIMTLDPTSPYPGSSRATEALAWFASGAGERRAVVAMPTLAAATELAGMLSTHELRTEAFDNGREAVDRAIATADLEVIFVDTNIGDPDIRQVIYELRISPTTAEIPIALLAPNGRFDVAQQIASEHDRVIAMPRIHSPEVLARARDQLAVEAGRFATPANERAAESAAAITWISRLAAGERPFYKLRATAPVIEAALYGTAAVEPAIVALGQLGEPDSQRALLNFASQPTLPIQHRSRAADAFRKNVAAHGLLLTGEEILTQYDRYNASEQADADTQRVLGALLDVIESRRHELDAELPPPPPRS